jgi:hypothetical protein
MAALLERERQGNEGLDVAHCSNGGNRYALAHAHLLAV